MPSPSRGSESYDVVVAGGGLGGMLAAAILAGSGRRVLLLEREPRLGGRLRSCDVDGFVVDAGAYLWPDAHLAAALRAAGADTFAASRIPANEVMRVFVQGRGGRRFAFPWPGRAESPKLLAAAEVVLRADAETFGTLCRLWDELAALPDEAVESLRDVTVGEALPRFAPSPRVAAAFRRNVMLFGTYDPDAASMAECIALRRRDPSAPIPAPVCAGENPTGGVRALVEALSRALAARGVEVRLGWSVDRIALDNGRVRGVQAHRGGSLPPSAARDAGGRAAEGSPNASTFIQAPAVVSNLPIWTLFDVIEPRCFPPAFVRDARRFAVVGGVIAAAFAFDGLPRLRDTGEPDRFRGWTRLLIGAEGELGGGLLWSSHHSPHNAPEGKHVLQAMRLSPQTDIADAGRVAAVHAAFRLMLDEIYLDAAEKLLWSRTWVTHDGSEYLICAAPRPPVRAPGVEGLYIVGETTDVPAVQMDAAALSALRAAELLSQPA